MVLTLEEASSVQAAREAFLTAEGIAGSETGAGAVGGLPSASADFSATTGDGTVVGAVIFIQHDSRVFQILGYAPEANWDARSDAIRGGIRSFQSVDDPSILNVSAESRGACSHHRRYDTYRVS